jgi:hypothetical protein
MYKRLGGGLQYSVYQISDTRVRKVPASLFQKVLFCLGFGYPLSSILESIQEVDELGRVSISELKVRAVPPRLLGNPTFGMGVVYEQDLLTPVGRYLEGRSLEEKKKVFDGYIDNMLELWQFGIADEVFNFTVNNGVTSDGTVVLTDLGELCFVRDDIAKLVEQKLWLTQRSFKETRHTDPAFSAYIDSEMGRRVTLDALNANWSSKI